MSRYMINDAESDALAGLAHIPFRLYHALRKRMDFKTGRVGERPKVSYQALREDLYVEPGQGKAMADCGSPSVDALRHALKMLERVGLVKVIPADRQLIFSLILADAELVRPAEVPQICTRATPDQVHQSETQANQGLVGNERQSYTRGEAAEVPHTSEYGDRWIKPISIESSSLNGDSNGAVDKSGMMTTKVLKITKAGDWVPIMLELGFDEKTVCSDEAAQVFYRWFADGVLPDEVREARRGAGAVAKTPMYLAKVVETRRAANGVRAADGQLTPALHWTGSWSGIVARGAELGVVQAEAEEPWVFKMRVFAKAGVPMPAVH
ncbi:hypothetical protein HZU75_04285 [Chitinibacter fontanus]|uniref:Uncharacterized protein n=1 Tax=Chitinibacter fontanus TaxID=1737446 RepID=A0A7D5ZFA6_9NEIS|nr:hypothetical protein [Chitinibacter fontanus]QLI80809.1 hypothetical protein HZU75_04285 [Chitinibacter fontanus]